MKPFRSLSPARCRRRRLFQGRLALAVGLVWLPGRVWSAPPDGSTNSPILANLSFDQLSQIKIVSVSQRLESLANAAAAVQVVTSEDIVRSGATSIPEALRNVPGLNVAQINGSTWAVGARGFQSEFASKLLVMEDGVSVYTPIYGGVYWDEQNYFLPDLDQIEVVLGPGGSIWGANAMNGVINILTKPARDTQGGLVYAGGGTEQLVAAGARYGWQTGTNTYARVYAMDAKDNHLEKFGGDGDANDAANRGRGGFRVDSYPLENTEWTLKGDVRWADEDNFDLISTRPSGDNVTNTSLSRIFGGQLMGRWQTELNPDSTLQLQAYYDYSGRETPIVKVAAHTADVQLHHTWTGWSRQVIDWGLDTRMVRVDSQPCWVVFQPANETDWLGSGFVQDEISLIPEELKWTGGFKLEQHSQGGILPQPNVRLSWQPAPAHTIWAAWSQALRSPSEVERNGQIDLNVLSDGTVYRWVGNPAVKPEQLQAWEAGWRWQARQQLMLNVDGYYYQYRDLIMATYGAPAGQVFPFVVANGTAGDAYGGEIALTWRPTDRWFATTSYRFEHIALHSGLPDPVDFAGDSLTSPRNTVALTSGVKLSRQVELTGALRYVDNIPYYNIPAYFELDLQLTWCPSEHWVVALAGQNLLQDYHKEYMASLVDQSAEIPRGVYAKVTWKF